MPQAIHCNQAATPAVNRPTLVPLGFARPDIPPSNPTPSRSEATPFTVNDDYKLLFKLMFQAIALFDRCDDCETLIDAGKLFQYLKDLAEDALEEAWEAN